VATTIMKQSDVKHVSDRLFDVLLDVEVGVALQALNRVIKEFERAKDEPEIISSRFRESKVD
jgi:hypothetical protein